MHIGQKWGLSFGLALIGVLGGVSAASADSITVNGVSYEELVSGTLGGELGMWKSEQKGYTYADFATRKEPAAVPVTGVSFADSSLDGLNQPASLKAEFMADRRRFFTDLTSSVLSINDADGGLLLSLSLFSNGKTTGVAALGARGELAITGLYNPTGGSWFNSGLLSGPIYAAIIFDTGKVLWNDFHLSDGRFALYGNSPGGEAEVPEPTSILLLCSGLVGLKRLRNN